MFVPLGQMIQWDRHNRVVFVHQVFRADSFEKSLQLGNRNPRVLVESNPLVDPAAMATPAIQDRHRVDRRLQIGNLQFQVLDWGKNAAARGNFSTVLGSVTRQASPFA